MRKVDYKRVTNKERDKDLKSEFCRFCKYFNSNPCSSQKRNKEGNYCDTYKRFVEIYDRLADLEDKIGSRTLIEFNKLEFNKPFVVLDYTSNGKEYYAIRIVEERDLAINLTKEKAEARLKELQEKQE